MMLRDQRRALLFFFHLNQEQLLCLFIKYVQLMILQSTELKKDMKRERDMIFVKRKTIKPANENTYLI